MRFSFRPQDQTGLRKIIEADVLLSHVLVNPVPEIRKIAVGQVRTIGKDFVWRWLPEISLVMSNEGVKLSKEPGRNKLITRPPIEPQQPRQGEINFLVVNYRPDAVAEMDLKEEEEVCAVRSNRQFVGRSKAANRTVNATPLTW